MLKTNLPASPGSLLTLGYLCKAAMKAFNDNAVQKRASWCSDDSWAWG